MLRDKVNDRLLLPQSSGFLYANVELSMMRITYIPVKVELAHLVYSTSPDSVHGWPVLRSTRRPCKGVGYSINNGTRLSHNPPIPSTQSVNMGHSIGALRNTELHSVPKQRTQMTAMVSTYLGTLKDCMNYSL